MVAAPVEGRSRRAPALLAGAAIATMAAIHLAAGYGTSGMPDSLRDLYWADEILRGAALPLRGPVIHGTIELGPWWYYVVALALAVTGSLAGASACVALLSAAKYALAWRLGSRLGDAWFGLAFVVALAVPCWSSAPLGFPTHTALVEAALLALALAAWRCAEAPTWPRAIALGAAAAFCAHAHPSTALMVVVAGVAVLVAQRGSMRAWVGVSAAALLVLVSLLPPLLARGDAAGEFATALGAYVARDVGFVAPVRVLRLLLAVPFGGAWHGMMLLTEVPRGEWIGLAVAVAAMATAAWGLASARSARATEFRWAGWALALLGLQAIFLVVIRPITPLWMTSTLVPPFALALACGWRGLARRGAGARAAATTAAALWFAVAVVVSTFFVRELDVVRVAPGANVFMDASAPWNTSYDVAPVARVRLRRIERAARVACDGAVVHGDLATADEMALGLPSRRACGDAVEVRYGGTDPRRAHLAGYVSASWCAIGLRPTSSASGFGYTRLVEPLAPGAGSQRKRLPPRQVDPLPAPLEVGPLALRVRARSDAVLALGRKYAWMHDLTIERVAANGRDATLVYEDVGTRFYRCEDCAAGTVEWTIEGLGNPAGIDLVALRDDPAGVDACAAR